VNDVAAAVLTRAAEDPFCMKSRVRDQSCYIGDNFAVLYNAKPRIDGHSLIVTRRHVPGLLDITPAEAKELFGIINRVLPALLDVYNNGERAYDIKIRSGEFSGWSVDHFHMHVIPRKRVATEDGSTEYERLYDTGLQNLERPFSEDIGEHVKMLGRGLESSVRAVSAPAVVDESRVEPDAHPLANVFYESRHFVAVYHHRPIIEGQALLVPKRDVPDFLELTGKERADLTRTYVKVMNALLEMYGDESRSYVTSLQTGRYHNMPLDRLHVNLIPKSRFDRYVSRDERMFYDLYENENSTAVMTDEEIRRDVAALARILRV
jgi:diadenosine tetraphosphate (Ap4A) HIT family hydrolase